MYMAQWYFHTLARQAHFPLYSTIMSTYLTTCCYWNWPGGFSWQRYTGCCFIIAFKFWYFYCLKFVSFFVLPFSEFDHFSLTIHCFSVKLPFKFYSCKFLWITRNATRNQLHGHVSPKQSRFSLSLIIYEFYIKINAWNSPH